MEAGKGRGGHVAVWVIVIHGNVRTRLGAGGRPHLRQLSKLLARSLCESAATIRGALVLLIHPTLDGSASSGGCFVDY